MAVRYYDSDTDGQLDGDATYDGTHYYLQDANFNVTAVVAVVSGTTTVLERYHYTPYGEVTTYDANWDNSSTHSRIANPYLYTARRLDAATGIYHYRTRPYHVQLGRFLGRDWIEYWGGDVNVYNYVGNGPLNWVDPLGLMPNREGGISPEGLIDLIEETEAHYRDANAHEVLRIFQNEMCWDFSNSEAARKLGLIDKKKPKRRLSWYYVYTEKEGWLDMGHFLTTARATQTHKSDTAIMIAGIAYEAYSAHPTARKDKDGKELPGRGSSAFTPEDVRSNRLGIQFGRSLKPNIPLSKQLKRYFEGLKAKAPKEAWNYMYLPKSEETWETAWQSCPHSAKTWARSIMDKEDIMWDIPWSEVLRQKEIDQMIWNPMLGPTGKQNTPPISDALPDDDLIDDFPDDFPDEEVSD